jgi:uncharacterized membrane protein
MNKNEIDKYVLINFVNSETYKNKLYEKYNIVEEQEETIKEEVVIEVKENTN